MRVFVLADKKYLVQLITPLIFEFLVKIKLTYVSNILDIQSFGQHKFMGVNIFKGVLCPKLCPNFLGFNLPENLIA